MLASRAWPPRDAIRAAEPLLDRFLASGHPVCTPERQVWMLLGSSKQVRPLRFDGDRPAGGWTLIGSLVLNATRLRRWSTLDEACSSMGNTATAAKVNSPMGKLDSGAWTMQQLCFMLSRGALPVGANTIDT